LTLRTKILVGVAMACGGYVFLTREDVDQVELAHPATEARHPHHGPAATSAHADDDAGPLRQAIDRLVPATHAEALFAVHSWYVAPPAPPAPPVVQAPPPIPTAPPLPFSFMGRYHAEDAADVFYLTTGERVFDVKIGDIIDNTYTVDSLQGSQLVLTYLPLKVQQSLDVSVEK
jgi:hypothetical protein